MMMQRMFVNAINFLGSSAVCQLGSRPTYFDIFMKMQGQREKCKGDIESYFLDRFEQVERSKIT